MAAAAMSGPLSGTRVADFSHLMAGPYCSLILADMGAEVIKIESPQGDPTRTLLSPGEDEESPFFLSINRNKKSVVLDLHADEGRAVALDLIARADVVLESFAAGVMDRFGLGYATLSAAHPTLIYCAVSAYGRSGPLAERAGYDPIIQGESGLMYLNGHADGEPHKTAIPIIDLTTGMFAAHAVLAALYARCSSGRGQFIDVPLFDSSAALTTYHTMAYLRGGGDPARLGNSSAVAAPVGLFEAQDGSFFLTVAGDRVWQKLVSVLGNPPELACEDFAGNFLRVRHQARLVEILKRIFREERLDTWMVRLRAAGVPAGPVRSIAQAVASPEMQARAVIGEAPHRKYGTVPNLRLPMTMTGTPLVAPRGAPLLGEHTVAVLADVLHYGPERVAGLLRGGVVAAWQPDV
ncbi:MAG: CoA transferase [Burkholderiaceae bacterium]|nr:CoA transferase [Burkholderiaceae bacterium]